MKPCCEDFAAHQNVSAEDGFRVWSSLLMLPYSVKVVRLACEIPGRSARSLAIRFCPWCGHDLEVSQPTPQGIVDNLPNV
jgi:hypothetical protein